MEKEFLEDQKRSLRRKEIYNELGYDIDSEREFILSSAQPISGKILEIGTGKGHFARALADAGYEFTSIDISEEQQKHARFVLESAGLDKKVKFIVGDAGDTGFEKESFDIIFSINAIHHFKNPKKVIREIIHLTAPEGKIVLSDFNSAGFDLVDKVHKREGGYHHPGTAGLNDIEEYFPKLIFNIKQYKSKFQDILIAKRIKI